MRFGTMVLSEVDQTEQVKYYVVAFSCETQSTNSFFKSKIVKEAEVDCVGTGPRSEGGGRESGQTQQMGTVQG